MKRKQWLIAAVLACCLGSVEVTIAAPLARPAVMAPLEVSDWDAFKQQLQQAKSIGVTAVSTDVWWGKVEASGDQQFDWSYYDQVSDAIIAAGLRWVPIFSFHQCGGNVGDDCNIPLPGWLWSNIGGTQVELLKYKSEQGNSSAEVISLWADVQAKQQYLQFVQAFAEHFASKAKQIEELNVSAGPSGELRYPSYNAHDNWQYPARGFLQAYSNLAVADFQRFAQARYGSLAKLNSTWKTTLTSWSQIRPPQDAPGFFARKDYLNLQYGRDFVEWYNVSLLNHGEFMINTTLEGLGNKFAGVPLGIKMPGIHWQMSSPDIPRSAEVSAGLIPTTLDLSSDATAHGYAPILERIRSLSSANREVVLHFTCLEMDNAQDAPQYSQAKNLVFWVGNGAGARQLTIMGENALAGGITSENGWNNIDNAIRWSSYKGLTTLRIGDLFNNNNYGLQRYQTEIKALNP